MLLGGGYPELYADTLSQNRTLMAQIKASLQNGLPCIAECGGFQYLCEQLEGADSKSYPMVGFLPGSSFRTPSLRRFGYVRLTAQKDNLLCKKGEGFAAHEFHYWDSQHCGNGCIAQKPLSLIHILPAPPSTTTAPSSCCARPHFPMCVQEPTWSLPPT